MYSELSKHLVTMLRNSAQMLVGKLLLYVRFLSLWKRGIWKMPILFFTNIKCDLFIIAQIVVDTLPMRLEGQTKCFHVLG